MTVKSKIVLALGEQAIALPALVNGALAANDRLKYRFALLQAARMHARRPELPFSGLRGERLASGVEPAELDAAVGATVAESDGYRIPNAELIYAGIFEDMQAMLAPFASVGDEAEFASAGELSRRLERLLERLVPPRDDWVDEDAIATITSGDRSAGDSLHLVVMDAHKSLNTMQNWLAAEHVDGAAVYGIAADDRELVRAFMAGIHRTAPLKFEHPGLGTTATRSGDVLVIQNDIGTTDAHVLVVHVREDSVSVTYTDVHLQRLLFFQGMFRGWKVEWEDARSRADQSMEDGVYHLCVGRHVARDRAGMLQFLQMLGSRLVFLIDWNKARKQIKVFLPKNEARELLAWAAANDLGHMAFLRCGGQQMLFETLELVGRGAFRYGEQLYQIIGLERAREFLQFALRICSQAMLAGRPVELVRDELRAELFGNFRSAEQGLFDLLVEHASYTVEIASCLRDGWLQLESADFDRLMGIHSRRAKFWERRADELVIRVHEAGGQVEEAETLLDIIRCADDVPDELEEAAFHCTLIPGRLDVHVAIGPLASLHGLTLSATQEYLKALIAARVLRRGMSREDMQDFLEAVHRVVDFEKMADDTLRQVRHALLAEPIESRQLYVLDAIAANLERATDALMHCVQLLRDQVLARVAA
ncbi:hypothetical protein ACKVEX_03865 [Rhodocyclaceae bacterium SMB388]